MLRDLFKKPVSDERPDVAAMLGPAAADPERAREILVVDGSGGACDWAREAFPHATWVGVAGEHGLPRHGDDPRRPPRGPSGGRPAVVLIDVLDRVVDVPHAVAAVEEVLAPGGRVLALQTVSPDDLDARADWNVIGRLRCDDHTWTPTRRQARAALAAGGLTRGAEALWAERADLAPARPGTERLYELFAAALAGGPLCVEGRFAVTRLALVLEAGG